MIIPTWGLIYAGLRDKETGFSPGKKFPGTRALILIKLGPDQLIQYINHSLISNRL
jgi:hypothetical protein